VRNEVRRIRRQGLDPSIRHELGHRGPGPRACQPVDLAGVEAEMAEPRLGRAHTLSIIQEPLERIARRLGCPVLVRSGSKPEIAGRLQRIAFDRLACRKAYPEVTLRPRMAAIGGARHPPDPVGHVARATAARQERLREVAHRPDVSFFGGAAVVAQGKLGGPCAQPVGLVDLREVPRCVAVGSLQRRFQEDDGPLRVRPELRIVEIEPAEIERGPWIAAGVSLIVPEDGLVDPTLPLIELAEPLLSRGHASAGGGAQNFQRLVPVGFAADPIVVDPGEAELRAELACGGRILVERNRPRHVLLDPGAALVEARQLGRREGIAEVDGGAIPGRRSHRIRGHAEPRLVHLADALRRGGIPQLVRLLEQLEGEPVVRLDAAGAHVHGPELAHPRGVAALGGILGPAVRGLPLLGRPVSARQQRRKTDDLGIWSTASRQASIAACGSSFKIACCTPSQTRSGA
jgi:hypothetical protein